VLKVAINGKTETSVVVVERIFPDPGTRNPIQALPEATRESLKELERGTIWGTGAKTSLNQAFLVVNTARRKYQRGRIGQLVNCVS
jgi:hypothetical protein